MPSTGTLLRQHRRRLLPITWMPSWPTARASRCSRTGTMRDDIRPGLRTSSYKKRAVIATYVDDETQQITILGVFYGGQDYDTILSGSDNA